MNASPKICVDLVPCPKFKEEHNPIKLKFLKMLLQKDLSVRWDLPQHH